MCTATEGLQSDYRRIAGGGEATGTQSAWICLRQGMVMWDGQVSYNLHSNQDIMKKVTDT